MIPIIQTISARRTVQSDNVSRSDEEIRLIKEWQAWQQAVPAGSAEYRDIAVARLRDCLMYRRGFLDLSALGLTEFPPRLPDFIESLSILNNKLRRLPAQLHATLKHLNAGKNQLTQLPDNLPDSIEILKLMSNNLTCLPEQLPASLTYLNVEDNDLTMLPAQLPASLKILNIGSNLLTQLPEDLPDSMEEFIVTDNNLTCLPTRLPASLMVLDVNNNALTTLPATLPAVLDILDVSGNRLTALPENLPPDLSTLYIKSNLLTHLPEDLPSSIDTLDASRNRLRMLPENLPSALLTLHVNDNLLTDFPVPLLRLLKIFNFENNPLPGPLTSAVIDNDLLAFLKKMGCWNSHIYVSQWCQIYPEENAVIFADFFKRLRGGKNVNSRQLQQRINIWIKALAKEENRELRAQTFLLAEEATGSCVDRASFYFSRMDILWQEHQLIRTDAPLTEVINAIRGLFRLQILEQIAAEKVTERQRTEDEFNEDLEIYLAYQCLLSAHLGLPIYTELQFTDIASISDAELEHACTVVAEKEQADFMRYWLTESALWTAKLEKWDATKKAAMEASYLDAISAESFKEAVAQELSENGLSADDAECAISCQLAAALFYQHREALSLFDSLNSSAEPVL